MAGNYFYLSKCFVEKILGVIRLKIKQIRNATIKINYADKIFLVDPWLIDRWAMGSFVEIPGKPFSVPDPVKEQIKMPICSLPESVNSILEGVNYYLITHIHPDHIDIDVSNGTVGAQLNKDVPIFSQDETDAAVIKKSGFNDVRVLTEDSIQLGKLKLTKTPALHGTVKPCGNACGVIFQFDGEPTLYLAGDTVYFEGVKQTLQKFKPDVIIMNTCAAELVGYGRLIMNDEDVEGVAQMMPNSRLVLSHMDNVAHASITRREMRGLMARRGLNNYFMPADGETLEF